MVFFIYVMQWSLFVQKTDWNSSATIFMAADSSAKPERGAEERIAEQSKNKV